MPLGRMLAVVFVFLAATNIALSRAMDGPAVPGDRQTSAYQAPKLGADLRLGLDRASRGKHRRPMAGLPRIKSKTCWDGFVGTVYDKCPAKPTPVKSQSSHAHSRFVASGSAEAWAHSAFAIRVANCESGGGPSDHHAYYDGDPHLRDGAYHGKWQMDSDFWASYGGLKYASDAADATEAEQDAVAYRGYLARGWEPWSCASMV